MSGEEHRCRPGYGGNLHAGRSGLEHRRAQVNTGAVGAPGRAILPAWEEQKRLNNEGHI